MSCNSSWYRMRSAGSQSARASPARGIQSAPPASRFGGASASTPRSSTECTWGVRQDSVEGGRGVREANGAGTAASFGAARAAPAAPRACALPALPLSPHLEHGGARRQRGAVVKIQRRVGTLQQHSRHRSGRRGAARPRRGPRGRGGHGGRHYAPRSPSAAAGCRTFEAELQWRGALMLVRTPWTIPRGLTDD
ncbi:MAG: hypothetical protein J3K34DRAFT_248635 [Monoraphidium minutum]|nr:MAG: hypothetical protein J3K34DRAFT_248635 [Monoraphidium minutum]